MAAKGTTNAGYVDPEMSIGVCRSFDAVPAASVHRGLRIAASIGLAAKALVYLAVGGLAIQLTLGVRDSVAGTRGAIQEIGQAPMGRMLLATLAVGLVAHTLWRLSLAILGWYDNPHPVAFWFKRIGHVCSGVAYVAPAFWAADLAIRGSSRATADAETPGMKTFILKSPGGRYALMAIAGVVAGVAVFFCVRAVRGSFMKKYEVGRMSDSARAAALWLGRCGLAARSVAFLIVAGFLFTSAYRGVGGSVDGIGDALAWVATRRFGHWMLVVFASGLICYAAHTMLLAFYIRVPKRCDPSDAKAP